MLERQNAPLYTILFNHVIINADLHFVLSYWKKYLLIYIYYQGLDVWPKALFSH